MKKTHPFTPCTVTIVGGGNSAHVLIPFLSEAGHQVNLCTRRPQDWNKERIVCDVQCGLTETIWKTHEGKITKMSSNPADVIPEADVIVLCMPVHVYREALANLAPFINRSKREVFVGTIYGQAGFDWMVHEMEREHKLKNVVAFAIGLIPWICRTLEYGRRCANYGGKQVNVVAVSPNDRFEKLDEIFLNDISMKPMGVGKFVQACSFLSLTLSVDNQIIHPCRCYALWEQYGGKWESLDDVPYFYRDFDDLSAENIRLLDEDFTKVRDAVRERFRQHSFKYMLSYLELERLSHTSGNFDIKTSFKESKQLAAIKTPTVEMEDGKRALDINCRFFTDDIGYGILIAKWIAEELDIETPFIDEIIMWAQNLRGEHFLTDDHKIDKEYCLKGKYASGIPPSYGIHHIDGILD
jgi:hypothetical protein